MEYIAQTDISAGSTINYVSASFSTPLSTTAMDDVNEGDTLYLQDNVQTLFVYSISGGALITRNAVNNTLTPTTDWVEFDVNGNTILL